MEANGIQDKWLREELTKIGVSSLYSRDGKTASKKLWDIKNNNQDPKGFEANAFCIVLGVQTIY